MRALAGGWLALLPLWQASGSPSRRLPALLAEMRGSANARFGCLEEVSDLASVEAGDATRRYQRSRGLTSEPAARGLLAALIEYAERPTPRSQAALLSAHVAAGATAAGAEDVCRCV